MSTRPRPVTRIEKPEGVRKIPSRSSGPVAQLVRASSQYSKAAGSNAQISGTTT